MTTTTSKSKPFTPHNIEAEQAVLGGILLNNDCLSDIAENLRPEDFYKSAHIGIYDAMLSLHGQNTQVDVITLADQLKKKNVFEKAGGLNYIGDLVEAVSTSTGANYHASLVRDASVRRQLMGACHKIFEKCRRPEEETEHLLEEAEQSVFKLATSRVDRGLNPISNVLQESCRFLDRAQSGETIGLGTGLRDLNNMIGGLQRKDLIILAGRPSMGKTALALNIAFNVAVKGHGVAIFSLEMAAEQLGLRLMATDAGVDAFKMRSGKLRNQDIEALVNSANKISELPMFVDDLPDINIFEIKSKIRRFKRQHGIDLVIVDYLQLMSSTKSGESRQREVSEICAGLKAVAKYFDVPVLALSQLNRRVEDRPKKRPELADLRESGSIEQDADSILFIYRPEVYQRTAANQGLAEIIVAKQRNGPCGSVKLTFLDRYTRFEDYSSREKK